MNARIGKIQHAILLAMRDGASLYDEGGMWYWQVSQPIHRHNVVASSCLGLSLRGFIMVAVSERHGAYIGGYRTRYELTDKGRLALADLDRPKRYHVRYELADKGQAVLGEKGNGDE